jgi:hypothetical protein
VVWQRGLVEREINELLRELTRDDDEERKKSKKVFSIMINKLLILIITFIE